MSLPIAVSLLPSVFPTAGAPIEAVPGGGAHRTADGLPDHDVVLDLIRPVEGATRIYVRAGLPDGSSGIFLVDTGADISVLSTDAAARIGLVGGGQGHVVGLSGAARTRFEHLPALALGDAVVPDVLVAVGVPGLQSTVGFLPIDGLLGNNVWSRFTVELDYPADTLVLHPAGTGLSRRKGEPMLFENGHLLAPIALRTDDPAPREVEVMAQIDTGAGELTLCAGTGLPLAGNHTEGLESVRGIGASETLPPYRFLAMTRRIPLSSVELGGAEVRVPLPARWLDYDKVGTTTCGEGPGGYRALVGHEYLADHRVIVDYADDRWALLPSRREPRLVNGHQVLLDEELAAHGQDPARGLDRARLLVGVGRDRDAVDALTAWRAAGETDPERLAEGTVLLAQLLRHLGRHVEAWEVLGAMSAGDLVDQGQIVGTVNGLAIDGHVDEARALAEDAIAQRPEGGWARVALADLDLRDGRLDPARDELLEAARLEGYPDAHLLRRARVALAAGDREGSMALVRRLLELYPGDGPYLWFYAMLVETPQDARRFAIDLDQAMARLHPFSRPIDFLVAAHHVLGDEQEVQRLLAEGTTAHCDPLPEGPDDDNCRAWYLALAGERPDEALTRIDRALAATGERADYLDTKAMVHLSRGEWTDAVTAAQAAARLSPDDVYMLWQAERIGQLALAAPNERRTP